VIGRVGHAAGDVVGEDLGLLPQRRHQAVDPPAVLGAFADDIDVGIVDRAHVIVDHDGALDGEPAAQPDLGVRLDAGGDDHHVAVERRAVLEGEAGHLAVAQNPGGQLLEMNLDAHGLHAGLEQGAADPVDLHLHEMPAEVHDVHLATVVDEATRGFESQEAAADHRGAAALLRLRHDAVAIVDAAEAEDPRPHPAVGAVHAGHGWNEGAAAGRDQQLVVALADAARGDDGLARAIDRVDPGARAGMQLDAVLLVPVERIDENFARVLGAAENVREQDAVIVAIGLVAEHDDFELPRAAARDHLLDGARSGHAISDDNESPFRHCALLVRVVPRRVQISRRPMSSTRCPAVPAGAASTTSSLVSGNRSSTTASGTCSLHLAPIGK
jgi:hypothetical protein